MPGTPSDAYFDHHDAPRCAARRRCARTSTLAQFGKVVRQRASHAGNIGNDNLRKVSAEFLNASTGVIASLHHHLITHARLSLLLASQELLAKCVVCGHRHQVALSARAF